MVVPFARVDHVAVEKLVEGSNGHLEAREGVEPGEGDEHETRAEEGDEDGPHGNEEVALSKSI